jgi:hypothetical protein
MDMPNLIIISLVFGLDSQQMATEIAKEGFPSLRSLPDERIFFTLSPRGDFNWSGPKLRIVDSAWESMSQSSPRAIAVNVEDTPREIAERKSKFGDDAIFLRTWLIYVMFGHLIPLQVKLGWKPRWRQYFKQSAVGSLP